MNKKYDIRSMVSVCILGAIIATFLASPLRLAAGQAASDSWDTWPPRNYLMRSLIQSVGETIKTFHPETGRFGTDPWISTDQNVLLPLAAAWSIKDPGNPYYHDAKLLTIIGKGGEALVDDQDADGMWLFRKKDNSTWGQIHMPWSYSRWIRAYALVKDALPAAVRAKWEKGLKLGFTGICRDLLKAKIQNIPCHHAMALYLAGDLFKKEEWKTAAHDYQQKIVKAQYPEGYWTENFGPVVSYNMVYLDALGAYYHFSKDSAVLEALARSVRFHTAVLWSDGTSAACLDERVIYHKTINTGNVGFTFSPEGRRFILSQLERESQGGTKPAGGDYAALLLLYAGSGPVAPRPTALAGVTVIGKNDAVVVRNAPWEWAFSAYATKPIQSRWIQDRQNSFDLFFAGLGMVAGGGNTKLQPYWSTFTVGDPTILKHREGDEDPNFIPAVDLLWTADHAEIAASGNPTRLNLRYGAIECSVSVEVPAVGLGLKEALTPEGRPVTLRVTRPLNPPLGTTPTV